MKVHEAANTFPMFGKARMAELIEDIRAYGQHVPITVYRGEVLDGRNRLAACAALGIEPLFEELVGNSDPWAVVWSLNGTRRDLVAEQRYLIWKHCHEHSAELQAELQRLVDEANAKRSAAAKKRSRTDEGTFEPVAEQCDQPLEKKEAKERKTKATDSKTNPGAVARGDKLAKDRPDLAEKVRTGEMKPSEAHRQMKKAEVVERSVALPDGKYRVLYADPPWKYGDGRTGDGVTATGAEHHYPTMPPSPDRRGRRSGQRVLAEPGRLRPAGENQ
jgi:hypothetical protein